jgi:hypothetical protein
MLPMQPPCAGNPSPTISRYACCLAALLTIGLVAPSGAAPLLPDLIAWENHSPSFSTCFMHCGQISTELIQNKVVYRFNGALPNVGAGPLEIREVTHPNGTQDVYQRIYQTEGGISEVLVGSFPDAASLPPRHLWLPGIAQYNLRTVTEGNGIGPVVSSRDKTSMAVVDSGAYNTSLPGAPLDEVYDDVGDPILGISIGWADIYSTALPGQWVEATGLPNGQYWLEVIADPYNRIQETNETNNTTRIMVTLFVPPPQIQPGDYNQDDVVDAADYVVWRNTLGQTVPTLGAGADGDGDGVVRQADFDVWRAKFGVEATGASSQSGEVPEPSAFVLCSTGLLALMILTCLPPRRRN